MKKLLSILLAAILALIIGLPIMASALSEEPPAPLTFSSSSYGIRYKNQLQLEVTGGAAPYRFECAENNLGLSVNANTGLIRSTYSLKKDGIVTFTVYDANDDSAICVVKVSSGLGRFIEFVDRPGFEWPSMSSSFGPILTFFWNMLKRIVF